MAPESRSEDPPVVPVRAEGWSEIEELLRESPTSFQFFQAVRLLEQLLPDRQPVGRFAPPRKEVVRFGSNADTSFPASQISSIEWPDESAADGSGAGDPPLMRVNFLGLTGPSGVLPLYYSMMVRERLRAKDPTMREFFGLFDHRMISLFYQAWEKHHFAVAYEKGHGDQLTRRVFDFIGMGTPGLQGRQAVPDDALLFYAGLLGPHPRSATALQQLLIDYFEVPVEIQQFVGSWRSLDEDSQCRFGDMPSYSQQLGLGVVVGDEVWDQQSGVCIRLGPLSIAQYLSFLPNGKAHMPLRSLAKFYSGGEFDFEVQLVLRREDVPQCELGREGATAPQLGWLSWAKTAPRQSDAGETILRF
ncbi:MAG: type VI secretion system baseplate subunit TssG [Bryobacterales bacterium]|nr:type VI secretion system baseplate subunit TssG [Bryobacterales bacterium]